MKRVGNLFDPIVSFPNLLLATDRAAKGGKKYKPAIATFLLNMEKELLRLQRELKDKTYMPRPYRQFTIYDSKKRLISVADFRDRVVHHALCNYLGPILDRSLTDDSYACRKGKGMHLALAKARQLVRQYPYFLKTDIRKYFESISHAVLLAMLERKIKDVDALWLITQIVQNVPPCYAEGYGLPIGNLSSQHFANFFLHGLDHHIKQKLKIAAYVRYMDDLLLLDNDKTKLWGALQEIVPFLEDILHLQINVPATCLAPVTEGLPFLGFRLYPERTLLQKNRWQRFKAKFRQRQEQYVAGEISCDALVESVQSMFQFVCLGDTYRLRRKFLDKYAIEV